MAPEGPCEDQARVGWDKGWPGDNQADTQQETVEITERGHQKSGGAAGKPPATSSGVQHKRGTVGACVQLSQDTNSGSRSFEAGEKTDGDEWKDTHRASNGWDQPVSSLGYQWRQWASDLVWRNGVVKAMRSNGQTTTDNRKT